jgi:hypothetical protein
MRTEENWSGFLIAEGSRATRDPQFDGGREKRRKRRKRIKRIMTGKKGNSHQIANT